MHINVSIPNISSRSCSKGIYRHVTFYKKFVKYTYIVGVKSVAVYRESLQGRFLAHVNRETPFTTKATGAIK